MRVAVTSLFLLVAGCASSSPANVERTAPPLPEAPGIQPQPQPGGSPYPRAYGDRISVRDAGAGRVLVVGQPGAIREAVLVRIADLSAPSIEKVAPQPDGSFSATLTGAPTDRFLVDVESTNAGRGMDPVLYDVASNGGLVTAAECLSLVPVIVATDPAALVGIDNACGASITLTPTVLGGAATVPSLVLAAGSSETLSISATAPMTEPFVVALRDGASKGRVGIVVLPPPR